MIAYFIFILYNLAAYQLNIYIGCKFAAGPTVNIDRKSDAIATRIPEIMQHYLVFDPKQVVVVKD